MAILPKFLIVDDEGKTHGNADTLAAAKTAAQQVCIQKSRTMYIVKQTYKYTPNISATGSDVN